MGFILALTDLRVGPYSIIGIVMLMISISIILNWELRWRQPRKIITGGTYSKVRHPFLSGLLLALYSVPTIFNSLPSLTIAITATFMIYYGTLQEEKELVNKYHNYRIYMEQVKYRFIPHII
ncbi:MAG: hypothetical protein KJ601_00205 [Nanoarchaeota archaeon]|nr:hypothetical protein [Nanoarchaeota archaeon]MBU1704232.1 hypothetical protein [Nanoarchaeota archaeon]